MKRIVFSLFFFLVFQHNLTGQTFELSVDTIHLKLKEIVNPVSKVGLSNIVQHQNKYFCFFRERGLYYFQKDNRYFLIVSKDGTILNRIDIPNEIKDTNYFDFFKSKDSLFVKTYMDHNSFYFDNDDLVWKKVKEVDDIVYEDDKYVITYLDFGEWGETTWFIDKKTNNEYIIGPSGTTINRINNKYYLTNGSKVDEIQNPHELQKCNEQEYYKFVRDKEGFKEGTFSLLGSKKIYQDTTYSPFGFEEPKQRILTSFVYENQLFLLFNDVNSTYIGKIENEVLVPIQNLDRKYKTYNWYYSYRGKNLDNNGRLLKFREDNNTFGTIEINNNKIDIHFLKHNVDSLNYLGNDGFDKLLDYSVNKMDELHLDEIDTIERIVGGTDLKIVRKENFPRGYFPDEIICEISESKKYIKVEDEIISLTSEYYYTLPNNLVKSIFLEWTITEPYKERKSNFQSTSENKVVVERFNRKLKEIVQIVTNQLDVIPIIIDGQDNYVEWIWESNNGTTIHLYGSKTFHRRIEIRLVIFKE